jgi:hypothetical protein
VTAAQTYGQLPLDFEANRGQTDAGVRFLAHGPGYQLFLTATEAVLVLPQPAPAPAGADAGTHSPADPLALRRGADPAAAPATVGGTALRMELVGANPAPAVEGLDELPGQSNYFIGNDPSKWVTAVPHYGRVAYHDVYPGIDLVYHAGPDRQLEYDWVLAPGADPSAIRLAFQGAAGIGLDSAGELVVHTASGDVAEHAPIVYQEIRGSRQPVAGGYVMEGSGEIGLKSGVL